MRYRTFLIVCGSLVVLCHPLWFSTAKSVENSRDPDEQLLEDTGIGSDEASLLDYLGKLSGTGSKPLDDLIRQLGSARLEERTQAAQGILRLGYGAISALREAKENNWSDWQAGQRAQECILEIERKWNTASLSAVVRLLAKHRSEAGLRALVRFLPQAQDEQLEEEIWFALDAAVADQQKLSEVLAEALRDPMPVRRAIAACIVGHRGSVKQRQAVRALLADPTAMVRLRAAQGLLAGRDKTAIPTLVALIEESPVELAWQAEELLHWVAGDDAPASTVGAGSETERKSCRGAWQAWWLRKGASIDLEKLDVAYRRPRLLLTCHVPGDDFGSVRLWGCDGKIRWQLKRLHGPSDVHLLPGARLLIAETSPARVSTKNLAGKVLWEQNVAPWFRFAFFPNYCQRLPDGNTFIVVRYGAIEVTPENKLAFARQQYENMHLFPTQVLTNGRVLCYADSREAVPYLAECERSTGKILKQVQVHRAKLAGYGPRDYRVQALPDGHYLLAELMPAVRLMEIDATEHIVWRYALKTFGRDALRLRNGNTLIMYPTHRGRDRVRIIEIDTAGRVVWELFSPDSDHCVRPCLPLCSLGFDSPSPVHDDLSQDVDYQLGRLARPDVRVRERAAYALADLGPKALPSVRALVKALHEPDEYVRSAVSAALCAIGPEALPEVLSASKDDMPPVRQHALGILGQFSVKSDVVLTRILQAVCDKDVQVRRSALRALQGHLSLRKTAPQPIPLANAELQRILPVLVHALSDPDSATTPNEATVSQLSAMLLEKLGPMAGSAVPAIVGAIRSKDYLLRGYAIAALASLETESKVAVPPVLDVLRFNDVNDPEHRKYLRNCVIAALGQVAGPEAEPAIPVLVSTLKDQNLYRTYRVSAAKALGKIGPKASSAIPALTDLLHCDDKQLRSEAEKALRDIRR